MLRNTAIVYFALATGLHAQTIYENSRILAVPNSFPTPGIGFHLSKNGFEPPLGPSVPPSVSCGDCETGIAFLYDGARIKLESFTLDGGSDWFLVEPGDAFSRATINAGRFPTIINLLPPPAGGEVTVGPGEFYLGVSTGMWVGPDVRSRTAYGWVHLRPVDGVLTMVENVMSYNSPGIIVGTTTIVPEPAPWALVTMAGLAFLSRRRLYTKAGCGSGL
jgi:hypothetical protein